ncbi:thiolase family protein [Haloarculaceae archaeon H-GB1-1]|nr:thiolase family protein [Haloarculaceae archaeon H-GB1-1]
MHEAVIVDAVRTPFGDRGGAFRDTHPQDLAAAPLRALERRVGFDPAIVEDVRLGCVTPIGEQGLNVGRIAPLVAGWDESVAGVQLNRMCGSGQQAVADAAAAVRAGFQDVVVAGGVEHMTRVPMGSDGEADSGVIDAHALTDTYFDHFDEAIDQGEAAERIADDYGFTREDVDELAVDSHQRWQSAWDAGHYDSQVVPLETTLDGESVTVREDGHPRPDSTVDSIGDLPLVFREEGAGVHHAGNSSGIVDGASALLVTSRDAADRHGWDPMARIVQTDVVGVDPVTMLTGPIPATRRVLEQASLDVDDVDLFEVNEAFASVVLAWLDELGASWADTNVNGGAIAHGHPLGATGAALLTKLVHELQRTGGTYGLSAMCIGFGQGVATLVERL